MTANDWQIMLCKESFPGLLLHHSAVTHGVDLNNANTVQVLKTAVSLLIKQFPVRLPLDLAGEGGVAFLNADLVGSRQTALPAQLINYFFIAAKEDQLCPATFVLYAGVGSQRRGKGNNLRLPGKVHR